MNLKDRFDLVIFDWAGTMVDFGCMAPVAALMEAFAQEGVIVSESIVRRDMGKAKLDHVRSLLAHPEVSGAWQELYGRPPDDRDVASLMARLGPLMRNHAAQAATLIPGAQATVERLRQMGVRIASSTGYTREMMQPVIARAEEQGYKPEHLLCSGETPIGRPAPLMIYKACAELGVWPLSRVVKVDDAEAGIAEGKAAGVFTVGVASGNALGLSREGLEALPPSQRTARLEHACQALRTAGADLVIGSVAELVPALQKAFCP